MLQKYLKYLICFYLLACTSAFGQGAQNWYLVVDHKTTLKFNDSLSCFQQAKKEITKAIGQGYLTAGITQVKDTLAGMAVHVVWGNKYEWVHLHAGNAEPDVLGYIGYRERFFIHKPFMPGELAGMIEKLLKYYENNGYPFASVNLDSLQINRNQITAALQVNKRQLFIIDSIEVIGNANIRRQFMHNYTGIKSGSPYNEHLIKQIDKRINRLSFAKTSRPLHLYFTGSKARIITYVDSKKASQVDGIIGFAPQSNLNNKLVLSGELNLNLQNLFGSGKVFELHYRSFLINSQDLKVRMVYPYLLNSPLGLDYNFALLKFDSLYLQVENDFGFQYAFGGSNYLKVFYNIQNTSLLSVDTAGIKNTKQLPQFADMQTYLYGLSLKLNQLDYPANPLKGVLLDVSIGTGLKKIRKNATINELTFTDAQSNTYRLYDSIELRSVQVKGSLHADVFWPLNKKNTIRTQLTGATLSAKEIFTNELYRIGGIKTLKGFDEQSIFATTYTVFNMEYRHLIGTNSNVLILINAAWYERSTRQGYITDTPLGFGTGVNFETGAGIFSLYYALGRQFNNPVQLKQGKVHFGLVNYF